MNVITFSLFTYRCFSYSLSPTRSICERMFFSIPLGDLPSLQECTHKRRHWVLGYVLGDQMPWHVQSIAYVIVKILSPQTLLVYSQEPVCGAHGSNWLGFAGWKTNCCFNSVVVPYFTLLVWKYQVIHARKILFSALISLFKRKKSLQVVGTLRQADLLLTKANRQKPGSPMCGTKIYFCFHE